MKKGIKFSVLMSVYAKENPKYLEEALNSVFNQTLKPSEVVLVEDGSLTQELESIIIAFEKKYKELRVIRFKKNRGLGPALNDGLKECKYDYIARMDTDDICRKDRFEKQINYLIKHPKIDVLGSNIYEFKESIKEDMRIKKMPTGEKIKSYIKKRNPLNHMTVCFKKKSVIDCGSYKSMLYLEDYYLWVRMFVKGKVIENINDELVYARVGNGFEKRRGNKKQIEGWKKLQKFMLQEKVITRLQFLFNMLRMYLMVFCPNFLRILAYKYILRK